MSLAINLEVQLYDSFGVPVIHYNILCVIMETL